LCTFQMASSVCGDEDDMPLEGGELEYAGDDDDDEDLNNARARILDNDDDDDDSEDDEPNMNVRNNNIFDRNRSRESMGDEMNLIDYVIEEEKEIGGAKGEESSTSRSTTYSRYQALLNRIIFKNRFVRIV
jgi:hypothetical protein